MKLDVVDSVQATDFLSVITTETLINSDKTAFISISPEALKIIKVIKMNKSMRFYRVVIRTLGVEVSFYKTQAAILRKIIVTDS